MTNAPTQTPEYVERTTDVPRLVHHFPRDPRYRLSRNATPQPGDIALCGWVKQTVSPRLPRGSATCVVCADMRRQF